jgi:hypothetical protein
VNLVQTVKIYTIEMTGKELGALARIIEYFLINATVSQHYTLEAEDLAHAIRETRAAE